MTDYDNTNSGVLFRNDKGDNPKRPDYRGSMNWNGEERWISAWIKDGKNGKFMSISVGDLKEQKQDSGFKEPPPADDFDSDIQF